VGLVQQTNLLQHTHGIPYGCWTCPEPVLLHQRLGTNGFSRGNVMAGRGPQNPLLPVRQLYRSRCLLLHRKQGFNLGRFDYKVTDAALWPVSTRIFVK